METYMNLFKIEKRWEKFENKLRENVELHQASKWDFEYMLDFIKSAFQRRPKTKPTHKDLLEKLIVRTVKPDVLRHKKFKYHVKCPKCEMSLAITNAAIKRAWRKAISQKTSKAEKRMVGKIEGMRKKLPWTPMGSPTHWTSTLRNKVFRITNHNQALDDIINQLKEEK